MNGTAFEEPVHILVGLGFPRKIASAGEAYQLLSDMKLTAGKAAHKMALQACKAAIAGEIDPEVARSAFVAFARRSAMLLPEGPALQPSPADEPSLTEARPRPHVSQPMPGTLEYGQGRGST